MSINDDQSNCAISLDSCCCSTYCLLLHTRIIEERIGTAAAAAGKCQRQQISQKKDQPPGWELGK